MFAPGHPVCLKSPFFSFKSAKLPSLNCTQYIVLYVTVWLRNTKWIDIVCNIFLKIPDYRTEIRINIAGIIIHKWKRMKWYSSSNGIQTQHWKVCFLFVYILGTDCLHILFVYNSKQADFVSTLLFKIPMHWMIFPPGNPLKQEECVSFQVRGPSQTTLTKGGG